ncbi:MAG TPA: DUF3606 domain-containing protein [Hymenobacter sp.]|jgi:hypothetical protein|uniref:DUF3606 domain-containing protein n=1 Tax=Hymenobacter sp. TaxID=1898978 RepID=UPI002ED87F02
MLHNTFLSPRQEGNTVDLTDEEAVLGWCEALSCTRKQLQEAVAAVGPGVAEVYKWLQERKLD